MGASKKHLASGEPSLTLDEVRREVQARRGGIADEEDGVRSKRLRGAGKSYASKVVCWGTRRPVSRADMTEEPMDVQSLYHYLVERPEKGTQELYIRGTGIRASTIWHDRYISQMHPRAIAQDRDLPVEVVYDALAYCQEHWEVICQAKAQEQAWLQERRFFAEPV